MISAPVTEASQVAEARRVAVSIAEKHGFGETDVGRVALVTTELASNLVKHGNGGEILLGPLQPEAGAGLQIIALDRGRGMSDVQKCLADGYSSAGTPGHGLGAVVRQSTFVEVASWLGAGTAVLAQIASGTTKPIQGPNQVGAVSIAKAGEEICGDAWAVDHDGQVVTLFVADGLGHGPDAAEASVEAVRLFHRFNRHQLPTLLDYIHGGLRSTRGAAVSLARYDGRAKQVTFAGIGNVAGTLAYQSELRRMVSMPGTAGYNVRKIQAFNYPFHEGLVILCSDGLSTSWTLAKYPDLQAAHPTLIAAVLYRDFSRRRDDVTVLVGKWKSSSGA